MDLDTLDGISAMDEITMPLPTLGSKVQIKPLSVRNMGIVAHTSRIKESGREASVVVYDHKNPIEGRIRLSRSEELVVETWLRSHNYSECLRELQRVYKRKVCIATIWNWFRKPWVEKYLTQRMDDLGYTKGWTREKWVRECTERAISPTKTDGVSFLYLKLIGQALGYASDANLQINVADKQINFVQASGER